MHAFEWDTVEYATRHMYFPYTHEPLGVFEELKRFMKLLENFGNSSKVFSRCFYDFFKFSENVRKCSETISGCDRKYS